MDKDRAFLDLGDRKKTETRFRTADADEFFRHKNDEAMRPRERLQ
jgi:hypothetical protein